MTSGTTLSTELKGIATSLPKEYGGQGASVKEGETVKLVDVEPKQEEAPAAADETKPLVTETAAPAEAQTAPVDVEKLAEVEAAKKEVAV